MIADDSRVQRQELERLPGRFAARKSLCVRALFVRIAGIEHQHVRRRRALRSEGAGEAGETTLPAKLFAVARLKIVGVKQEEAGPFPGGPAVFRDALRTLPKDALREPVDWALWRRNGRLRGDLGGSGGRCGGRL